MAVTRLDPPPVGPKVLLVGPVVVAWDNPSRMQYGGVERVCWRLAHMLSAIGCEVVVTAPKDSLFEASISRRGLWREQSLCQINRELKVFAEDLPTLMCDYCSHVITVLESEQPTVVILLGPSAELLYAIIRHTPRFLERAIVSLHNGPSDNVGTVPLLRELKQVKIVALSEIQRRAFTGLSDRIEVVLDGIPVSAVPISLNPTIYRYKLSDDLMIRTITRRLDRPILSQIDYFHPNKGMLITLALYRESRLYLSHDLILAGGMGWQLPQRSQPANEIGYRYLNAIRSYIVRHSLSKNVRVLGGLTGSQVIHLLRGSDLVISPARMSHGDLWTYTTDTQDPESYGQSRALANAAGTPVLMSNKYDPSFAPSDLPELRFDSFASGVARLQFLGVEASAADYRRRIREFAEMRDSILFGFSRYMEIIHEIIARMDGITYRTSNASIVSVVNRLTSLEAEALTFPAPPHTAIRSQLVGRCAPP